MSIRSVVIRNRTLCFPQGQLNLIMLNFFSFIQLKEEIILAKNLVYNIEVFNNVKQEFVFIGKARLIYVNVFNLGTVSESISYYNGFKEVNSFKDTLVERYRKRVKGVLLEDFELCMFKFINVPVGI